MALVGLGAVLGLAANAVRPDGVQLARYEPPVQCSGDEGEPQEVEPAHVASLCGRTDVVIADARPAARYAEGHIAGAVHLPCNADGRSLADALGRFAGARMIVVYGDTTDEAKAVAASVRRRDPGSARVTVLTGGFAAWSRDGRACESGPCDECKATEASHP